MPVNCSPPEYDSRKNRVNRMKRKQFFSVSHFAMPLPTVNCQLSTVNWIHTFSQLPVANWYDVMNSNTTATDAILDRLVHTSVRFELEGVSMRKKINGKASKLKNND